MIKSDTNIGLTHVCADWIDEQAPVMICDAEPVTNPDDSEVSYDLVNCSEERDGRVSLYCPTTLSVWGTESPFF